jgi:hypothetical protein
VLRVVCITLAIMLCVCNNTTELTVKLGIVTDWAALELSSSSNYASGRIPEVQSCSHDI